jgi:hypothetical protein
MVLDHVNRKFPDRIVVARTATHHERGQALV